MPSIFTLKECVLGVGLNISESDMKAIISQWLHAHAAQMQDGSKTFAAALQGAHSFVKLARQLQVCKWYDLGNLAWHVCALGMLVSIPVGCRQACCSVYEGLQAFHALGALLCWLCFCTCNDCTYHPQAAAPTRVGSCMAGMPATSNACCHLHAADSCMQACSRRSLNAATATAIGMPTRSCMHSFSRTACSCWS